MLDYAYASQMEGIITPRLLSGREAVPPSMQGNHPSAYFDSSDRSGSIQTGPRPGSSAYYERCVSYYAEPTGGDVPIIPIIGALDRYGFCSWGYEDLTGLIQAADRSGSVKATVLKMNTPGGGVDGLRAFADAVKNTSKPVVVWTPFCASAGVYIASQADEIILEDQSVTEIGSIGVIMLYMNYAGAYEKAGIVPTIFRSDGSEDKAPLNGIEPLSEATIADIKATLNGAKKEFHGAVKRGRAGRLSSDEWTSGKMFNTKAAISMGLADRTGSLELAVARARQLAKPN